MRNSQEKSVRTLIDENDLPNHWYFSETASKSVFLSNVSLKMINIRFNMASTLSKVLANNVSLSNSIYIRQYLGETNPPDVRSIAEC